MKTISKLILITIVCVGIGCSAFAVTNMALIAETKVLCEQRQAEAAYLLLRIGQMATFLGSEAAKSKTVEELNDISRELSAALSVLHNDAVISQKKLVAAKLKLEKKWWPVASTAGAVRSSN
ncbi:MAG: hypothetical protein WCW33_03645 [Candidatus Babeliales bacterium]